METNPYAAPQTASEVLLLRPNGRITGWLRNLLLLQVVIIVVAIAVEAFEHQSIVISGAIFSLVGALVAIFATQKRNWPAVLYGCSAVAFALLIVFLININRWSPAQGDKPITILAYAYAVIALSMTRWLFLRREKLPYSTDPSLASDTADSLLH